MEQSVYTKETPVAAWRQCLETLLLAAAGASAYAMYRTPGAALDVSVGWLVLLPVLSGAQHGSLFGFVSAGALCAVALLGFVLPAWLPPSLDSFSSLLTQGWGLVFAGVGGIAGFFRDLDERRYAQLSYRARVNAKELETLERAFACLQWSHTQLEQQFCTEPHSLASILDAARERMRDLRSTGALAELILEVIAARTPVQSASFFALGPDHHVSSQPVASLGEIGPQLDVANHPLVQRALRSSGLVSIVDAAARARTPQAVLVAVALQSSCAQLRLLFVVHQLPFEAFCVEELRNLHVLLARLIDLAQQRIAGLEHVQPSEAYRRASSPWSAAAGAMHPSAEQRLVSGHRAHVR